MNFLLFLFFGIAPSIIWLLFYLREDVHPEPKWMIRKVFLWGMLATIPVIFIEMGLRGAIHSVLPSPYAFYVYMFLGVALIEELAKYAVVRLRVYKTSAIDEPPDVMIYMIVAGLGFAALENVLMLFGLGPLAALSDILLITLLRFAGATFLHALVSGLFGYFIAISWYNKKYKALVSITGLVIAVFLHGLFNFSIMEVQGLAKVGIPVIILFTLAVSVVLGFWHLRKLKSVQR
ncbi:MAG: PrsW family intramembrane metalloprotease [Candidatus Yanofskybacteria bacterium]|nr:PrsW family intramembrane metalloprotease [Candidatus Yanofskybacteria bacterium]